jgi:hypothetical protein
MLSRGKKYQIGTNPYTNARNGVLQKNTHPNHGLGKNVFFMLAALVLNAIRTPMMIMTTLTTATTTTTTTPATRC